MSGSESSRRRDLAAFLKQRRSELNPGDFGFPEAGKRRTPGLRREEVAVLVGVSTSWYTWLEQGRDVTPSVDVLDAIARTFQLTPAERRYVLELAHPEIVGDVGPAELDTALVDLIELIPSPATIMDRSWFYLAWNRACVAVFGSAYDDLPHNRKHMMWLLFRSDEARAMIDDWPRVARESVGQYRAALAEGASSPEAEAMVEDLLEASPEFQECWSAHEVAWRGIEPRRVLHPDGTLDFNVVALRAHDSGFPRVVTWTPANEVTRERMARLLSTLETPVVP